MNHNGDFLQNLDSLFFISNLDIKEGKKESGKTEVNS